MDHKFKLLSTVLGVAGGLLATLAGLVVAGTIFFFIAAWGVEVPTQEILITVGVLVISMICGAVSIFVVRKWLTVLSSR